jgi:hypothetical protein
MKKTAFLIAIACFLMISTKAQLANSKWKGEMGIPQGSGQPLEPTEAIWDFKTDTLVVHFPGGGEDEVMTYRLTRDVLTLRKVSGSSQCDDGSTGTYKYRIQGDQFFISVIQDSCEGRSAIDFSKPYTKID